MADYAAPAVYWSFIETSLAVVSACLPTLRPIFKGISPEGFLQSLRGRIPLSFEWKFYSFSRQRSSDYESTSSITGITVQHDSVAGKDIRLKNRSNQG